MVQLVHLAPTPLLTLPSPSEKAAFIATQMLLVHLIHSSLISLSSEMLSRTEEDDSGSYLSRSVADRPVSRMLPRTEESGSQSGSRLLVSLGGSSNQQHEQSSAVED